MTYVFVYTDGTVRKHFFKCREDASWFAHNEGDHLLDWYEDSK